MVLCLVSLSFVRCGNSSNGQGQVIVNSSQPNIGENLDLRAVGEVIKNSKNPQEIEQKLNADDGINNLDLDGDGKRDYLKVTEYGKGSEHGYSICAVLKDGEPEVANVVVNTATSQMTMNGNSQYYGTSNNTYQSSFTTTDFLLLAWLMQPNYSYYHSPYYYGHYGYGYSYRPIVSYHSYSSRPTMRTTTRYTTVSRPTNTIKSPNSNNTSSLATKRISNFSNASTSQKAFKSNQNSTPKGSGGFGNKSNSSSSAKPSNSSSYKSSSSPKSSGFGSSSKTSSSRRR